MDPVVAAVLALAEETHFGAVIDVGCGRGQLALTLLEAGGASSVLALDQDAQALAQLRIAAAGLPCRVQQADLAADWPPAAADTVMLVDMLYQLEREAQLALLARAANSAGRLVVIRTIDPKAGWRSRVSAVVERVGRGIWPTFGERWNPLAPLDLAAALERCGFVVQLSKCAQGTPLAGLLLVGRRASAAQRCTDALTPPPAA